MDCLEAASLLDPKVGMYEESSEVREQKKAWGIIRADVARHVDSVDRQSVLHEITRVQQRIGAAYISC